MAEGTRRREKQTQTDLMPSLRAAHKAPQKLQQQNETEKHGSDTTVMATEVTQGAMLLSEAG